MRYRSEIDGLRALAVIPVVLFHARVAGFEGGYVGVDIFFVISGYLITSLIIGDIRGGAFSFLNFYERRVRRIIPPLALVTLISLIVSFFLLLPRDFKDFSQSVVAITTFASNILFWKESGYFEGPAEIKPLLHTWSLAVEEQFYIIFPVLLFVVARFSRGRGYVLLGAALALSLAASAWGVHYAPSATFYLLPYRGWELLIGAIAATGFPAATERPLLRETASWVGLLLIAWTLFAFDRHTPFPGPAALLPCVGTVLLIWSNEKGRTRAGEMLAQPWLVSAGLISYSLYLWHWPILVFSRYYLDRPLGPAEIVGAVMASVLLAWLSWKFIETPIRRRRVLAGRRWLFGAAAILFVVLGAAGLSGHFGRGMPERMPKAVAAYAMATEEFNPRKDECMKTAEDVRRGVLCRLGDPAADAPVFLLWGDSHADMLMPAFEEMAREYGIPGLAATQSACPPLVGAFRVYEPEPEKCLAFNDAMLASAAASNVRHVVLVGRWAVNVVGRAADEAGAPSFIGTGSDKSSDREHSKKVFEATLRRTVSALQALGVEVWIVKQAPNHYFDPPARLAMALWKGGDVGEYGVSLAEHRDRQAQVEAVFGVIPLAKGRFVDPADMLCSDREKCRMAIAGRSLYRDNDHLAASGARWLSPLLRDMFETMAAR